MKEFPAKAQRRKGSARTSESLPLRLCAFAGKILLGVLIVGSLYGQTPLTPQESRGKEIYLQGASKSGKDILAYIGDSSLEVPGSSMACANCHGMAGQGKSEGGIDPSNITWEALTKPYGVTHASGRKHPAYTVRGLELAITRGLDPAGNKLQNAMPRYQMSKQDLADLLVYLKRLGSDLDPGISDTRILIGTTLPASGPLAEIGFVVKDVINAYFAEVNLQGGVYNRRLELKVNESGSTAAATRTNVEHLINDEHVFAMTSVFLAGSEKELVPVFAHSEVPLVGPMTLNPLPGTPVNRQIFYLLSGNGAQAGALISFLKQRGDLKDGGLAVIYHRGELNASVREGVLMQCERESLKPPTVYEYTDDQLDADEYVKVMRQKEPTAVFFIGSLPNSLAFMNAAAKVNWFPQILLQGGGVASGIFDAPPGFDGKIFFTAPNSPFEQTAGGLSEFKSFVEKYKLPQKNLGAQAAAYSSAKVLVEAMKRVGKELSREKLIQTLEGFYEFQTGLTPPLTYGPNRRVGAMGAYVVTVQLKEKQFKPVSGWVGIEK